MSKFGLVGKNIEYSFSRAFFSEKFEKERIKHSYENFDIPSLVGFPKVISENPDLKGLNVTIPYKEEIIPFLNELDETAQKIGAVNVIKILEDKTLIGFNSDYFGFQKALSGFLPLKRKTALILGTGGASKAVAFALENLGFEFIYVSRSFDSGNLKYSDLNNEIIRKYLLIINCTPLGTFPRVEDLPNIPYQFLTSEHLLFDLIYNPLESRFLEQGQKYGAKTSNGLAMLQFQAEKAWEIWNF